jgi:plasmid stability protein
MPQLLVRNLEETVVRQLKKRAGEHGVSMEEEHRRILRGALATDSKKPSFWEHLSSMPDVGDDSLFERDRTMPARATEQHLFQDE